MSACVVLLFVLGLHVGCRCQEDTDSLAPPQPDSASKASTNSSLPKANDGQQNLPPGRTSRPLLELKDRCMIREHGLVIDLGSNAAAAYDNFRLSPSGDPPEQVYYQGQSFRPLDRMSQDFVFWTQEDLSSVGFEALVHGDRSERIAVYIDGVRMGAARLKSDEVRVVRISKANHEVKAGRHRLTLALSRPSGSEPSADIGWIRLGQLSETDADQPSPRDRVFSEVTIGKDRQAGIVVKPGALVSCPLWLAERTRLSMKVGIWGAGLAEGEVVVVDQDGKEDVVARIVREEDKKRDFEDVDVDLGAYAEQLIDLQFRAQPHARSARVVFGAPQLSHDREERESSPKAKRAIVVVLGSLGARHSPPAAATAGLVVLNQLAQVGTTYPNYRVTSTSPTAVIASLLTGLAPYQHGLEDLDRVLPQQLSTLAGAVEAAGGRSAFMTGVPLSASEFGLDRGFESFAVTRPQEDKPATAPLRQAVQWLKTTLDAEGPVLSLVHLRGAHPPFDISKERARELPPAEYGGDFTPRRAAIQLGDIARRSERRQRMNDEDWTRTFAMEKAALALQSAELSDLVQWLRQENLYNDTLLIVMGDVASGERPTIPYSENAPLEEQFLATPLVVKYPNGHLAEEHIKGLFAPRDVAKTIALSLGLDFDPARENAIDLAQSGATRLAHFRPHLAYRKARYSMRLGSKRLAGKDGQAPHLCFVEIDPACQIERGEAHAAMEHALWLTAFSELSPALLNSPESEPMKSNEPFENALIVWGVLP